MWLIFICMTWIFCKKIVPSLLFPAVVRPQTFWYSPGRVATAYSTDKYKYEISWVGQSTRSEGFLSVATKFTCSNFSIFPLGEVYWLPYITILYQFHPYQVAWKEGCYCSHFTVSLRSSKKELLTSVSSLSYFIYISISMSASRGTS